MLELLQTAVAGLLSWESVHSLHPESKDVMFAECLEPQQKGSMQIQDTLLTLTKT